MQGGSFKARSHGGSFKSAEQYRSNDSNRSRDNYRSRDRSEERISEGEEDSDPHEAMRGHHQSHDQANALEVEIRCGRDLLAADMALFSQATSDPYCHVEIQGKPKTRKTTKVIDKTLNPDWNQVFTLKDYQEGDALYFEVWDKDYVPMKSDDLLGKAVLDARNVSRGFEGDLMLKEAGDKTGKSKIVVKVRKKHRER
jgi:Ca2+-dependent lipid-binding protein